MSKSIAFFDFDGTVTTKDTLFEIIKFQKGIPRFAAGIILLSPVLVLYKLKIISNQTAKEQVLRFFFGNMSFAAFQEECERFGKEILPSMIRSAALAAIRSHQDKGTRVIIVSASVENWMMGWCRETGVEYIGTQLEVKEGRLTGKIKGKNCYGSEKVNRIKELLSLEDYNEIYAYGDSNGDKAMLKIATHAYYKYFH